MKIAEHLSRYVRSAVLLLGVVGLAAQHTEPPAGWTCANHAKTPADHKCDCHRTCEWNPNTRQVEEKEDPKCKSWCYRDHCTCLSECDSQH